MRCGCRENGGTGVARNTAIDMATGEGIAVLDADDRYEPVRLETSGTQLKAAELLGLNRNTLQRRSRS